MQKTIDDFQIKLLRHSSILLSVVAPLLFIIDFLQGKELPILIASAILTIVSVTSYILITKTQRYILVKYLISIFSFCMICMSWLYNYSSQGPALLFFTAWIMFIVFIWERKTMLYFLFGFAFLFFVMAIFNYLYPDFDKMYPTGEKRIFDMYYGAFFTFVLVFFYSRFVKRAYLKKIERTEKAKELKSAFLQNISHEIRTPMNAIIGFSELLRTQNLSSKDRQKYLDTITSSSEHLLSIIDDIMKVSLLETEQVDIEKEALSLTKFFHTIYETMRIHKLLNENVILRSPVIDLDKNYIIEIDAVKLKQILQNLIVNAIKYTKNGYIEFGCRQQGAYLEFYVKDTGVGIDPKDFPTIFKRFTQITKTHQSRFKGAGLGLSICKSYVELLGGNIWVQSKPGKGSTFFFTIPFEILSDKNGSHKLSKTMKKTILVAEDEDINFEFLNLVLAENYNVLRAANGQEVLNILDEGKKIDCILMDIKMPRLNGIETAKIVKKTHPDLYIIAQTAYSQIEQEFNISHNCFDDYVLKPINPKNLQNLLSIILD